MEVNKIVVKFGREYYTGYYWIEPGDKGVSEIHISYEGVQKSQVIDVKLKDKQRRIAEEIFLKLLGEL